LNSNFVTYFEIPVNAMDRAIEFYESVFATRLTRNTIDDHGMALLPADDNRPRASGALAAGDSYVASSSGPRIYFLVDDIDAVMGRAKRNGATIAYPKTSVGDLWVAEIIDSEGNQIALSAANRWLEAASAFWLP
jgi:predicted enzyme related to lactoylglutathione lyase